MIKPVHISPDTPENRELTDNVHPPDWINPEPAGMYNLVVIGAGTAGLISAAGAAGLGGKVALIERHLMGGDCLNVGCVPSKAIIRASRALHDARNSGQFGVNGSEGITFDFPSAMERMRKLRSSISRHDSARRFRDELGVDVFIGEGCFVSPGCIEVDGRKLHFKKAAVCTGARAGVPVIPGLAEAGFLTNETVFSLTTLPKRLAVLGSGPIGCELAQAFARFGSHVTMIERGMRILGREDRDAADILEKVFVADGIDIRFGAVLQTVELQGNDKVLRLERNGAAFEIRVDQILIGIGRTPNLEGLGLEQAGIKYDSSGVLVSDTLQSSNPDVYAAGDICSRFKFTHTADAQARILIANALFKGRQKTSALTIPWCTYTDPEIAHVGMYESDAAQKGIATAQLTVSLSDVDRAILDGEIEGLARVLLVKGTDRILGATIVACHGGEMLNELSLAITNGLGLGAIAKTIHPYPTQAEAIKKLADAYNRTRLTPFVKKVLAGWLKWQRSGGISYKKPVLLLAAAIVITLFFYFDLGRYLSLDSLKSNRQTLLDLYTTHRFATVAGFMAIYIIQTALSLPGAAILSLAAGAIFGSVMGTVYANIAATIGATLAFLVARYLLRDFILNRFGSRLEGINRELDQRGLNYLLFLRLVPLFPFFLINLAAAMTRLRLRTFVLGTMIGIIPGGFVFVNAGASLANITDLKDIASPKVLGSFALLGLFALIPALYSKFKGGKH